MANGTEERPPGSASAPGTRQYRHFILDGVTEVESYRSPQGGKRPPVPERDRWRHGIALLQQLLGLYQQAEAARNAQQQAGLEEGFGLLIEFESFPGIELAFESLARERSGIELLNVRSNADLTRATVFVPDGKLEHFVNLIIEYLTEKRDSRGRALDHKNLLNTIREIRAASLRALWTDDEDVLPTDGDDAIWWEVWLPVRQNRSATVDAFRTLVAAQGMRVAPGAVDFPERTVLLVSASVDQMQRSMLTLNSIAELRRPKETAEFFDSLEPEEQHEWLDDLLGRTFFVDGENDVTYVCVLDTGVTRDHPLLKNALDTADLHTVEPAWLVGDDHGHGTSMAGLALFGDLTDLLSGSGHVYIRHRLESVKILRTSGSGVNDPQHHGYLTVQAVARPEIAAPSRSRVFSMAVTARDNRDRGRPSAWSAALDSLAAGSDEDGANPRLLVVSAGNSDNAEWLRYPEGNETDGVHDPAQAWNVLTVGAYTDLVRITEDDADGYEPVAPRGGLSPFSTTSLTWDRQWPLKPDVVLEGGNAAKDSLGAVWMRSLSLLTTHHRPTDRMFTTANATSAATALASRLAAQVMAAYPDLWPETIRALIVQSAEWTDAMIPVRKVPSKADYRRLVQRCGFGVPNLDRALWSVANSLTMVVQERLHPFKREIGKHATLRDMHVHRLPWPQDVLENLGDTPVAMRVTLSYFIEPNPSRRGDRSRYRYESHGLRFDVKLPAESNQDFRTRINAAARDDEAGRTRGGDDPGWTIGVQSRHRGSLHSDIWRGSAAELASRAVVAVYPTLGWWKSRPGLKRYHCAARYALVVSITAPEVDVDLYTEVDNRIRASVAVER